MAEPAVVVTSEERLREIVREELEAALGKGPRSVRSDVLTLAKVAEMLDCTEQIVVRKYVKRLGMPGHRFDREWRFLRSEVLGWLKEHGT